MHREQLRHGGEQAHGGKVLHHVERQLRVDVRVDGERAGGADDDGVAVGRGPGNVLDADDAVGAGTVVDDHRVVHSLVQLLRERPRQYVDRPAGRIGHYDADRFERKLLCVCEAAGTDESQGDSDGCQMKGR